MPCDLVLEIGPGSEPGEYRVDVDSPAGAGTGTAPIRVDALLARRREVAATVLASAVPLRGRVAPHELPVRDIGTELFGAVFGDRAIYGRFTASMQAAANQSEPLRVILRLRAPQLAGLPWETLFDPQSDEYLCQREPVLRFVEVAQPNTPLSVEPPLRILGMVAAPRDLPALDVDEEKRRLSTALTKQHERGMVELVWADGGSWPVLQSMLLDGPWHVVHFIGHGGFDESERTGVLALEDAVTGRSNPVTARKFASLLRTSRPVPRLIILNSCQSGEAADDLLSSTAAELVRSGTSAAVAMQFAITDTAALAFSRGFYEALARDLSVEEAVRNGRTAIEGTSSRTLEWVTPVLYSRTEDTNLFALRTVPLAGVPAAERDAGGDIRLNYLRGLTAARAERWDEAITLLDSVVARQPNYEDAAEQRDNARRARQLSMVYDLARAAEDAGNWRGAVKEYADLLTIEPAYRDAAQRREACERAARIALLQEQIRMLGASSDWQGVLAAGHELESLDPSGADIDGLVSMARQTLRRPTEAERAASERAKHINHLRNEMQARSHQKDWNGVLAASEELQALDPSAANAYGLATAARDALRREAVDVQAATAHAALVRQLQERVQALGRDQDWRGVLAVSEQLSGLDASAADVDGLATIAREEVRRADEAGRAAAARDRKILDLQKTMRKAARKRDWAKVLRTSGELAKLDAALADVDGLATQATQAMRTPGATPTSTKPVRSGGVGNWLIGTTIVMVFAFGLLFVISGIWILGLTEEQLRQNDYTRGTGVSEIVFGSILVLFVIPLGMWLRRRVKRRRASA